MSTLKRPHVEKKRQNCQVGVRGTYREGWRIWREEGAARLRRAGWRPGLGFRVSGFGFRVSGFGFRVSGLEFQVSGFEFRVSGFGLKVQGKGFDVYG